MAIPASRSLPCCAEAVLSCRWKYPAGLPVVSPSVLGRRSDSRAMPTTCHARFSCPCPEVERIMDRVPETFAGALLVPRPARRLAVPGVAVGRNGHVSTAARRAFGAGAGDRRMAVPHVPAQPAAVLEDRCRLAGHLGRLVMGRGDGDRRLPGWRSDRLRAGGGCGRSARRVTRGARPRRRCAPADGIATLRWESFPRGRGDLSFCGRRDASPCREESLPGRIDET